MYSITLQCMKDSSKKNRLWMKNRKNLVKNYNKYEKEKLQKSSSKERCKTKAQMLRLSKSASNLAD